MKTRLLVIAGIGANLLFTPAVSGAQETAPVMNAPATEPVVPATPSANVAPAPAAAPAPEAKPTEPEFETLAGSGDIESGGYGGPGIKFGRIAGNNAVFVGGRGGWIINHHFVIGAAGYGMATKPLAPRDARTSYAVSNGIEERLGVGYGGLMMEYFIMPKKMIHATVGVLVGGGGISVNQHLRSRNVDNDRRDMMDGPSDSFFIAEPEIHCELNIVHFLRVDLGASYRVVTGVNGIGLENKDLRGPGGSLLLRFGKF